MKVKKYKYIAPFFTERFLQVRMEEYQNEGWEVCGNLNPHQGGAGNNTTYITVPMRKEIE